MPNLQASLITASVFLLALGVATVCQTEEVPKRAPYNAVRWEGESPEVRIDEAWVSLVSINDVPADKIVGYAKKTYGPIWQKRFEEDLVEVLLGMGHRVGETVTLVVREADATEATTLDDVPMTLANRQAIWQSGRDQPLAKLFGWLPHRPESLDTTGRPYAKLSPYDAVRWVEETPSVRLDNEWVTLESIDGVMVESVVAYCQGTYGDRWQKRFEEDLVEVFAGMGQTLGTTVDLVMRKEGDNEVTTLSNVPMTKAKRQAIWWAAQAREADAKARVAADEAAYATQD